MGDRAPALALEKLLQAPPGPTADWESLQGNVVVLEFWATWCGPCVQAVPFLNKLHDAFKDKPVAFISITDEREATVTAFLTRTPVHGWIGLDADGSAFRAYGVSTRPTTVVVDRDGKLAGWITPYHLIDHPDILDDLIAGSSRNLGGPESIERLDPLAGVGRQVEDLVGDAEAKPLCLILIRPAQPLDRRPRGNTDRASVQTAPLRPLIAQIYGLPYPQVVGPFPFSQDQKYDVIFSWAAQELAGGRDLLKAAIEATFGLQIRRERRLMDVYVLRAPDVDRLLLEPAMRRLFYEEETGQYAPTEEILERQRGGETFFIALGGTEALAHSLSTVLDHPVVDEAHIDGNYLFYLPHDFEKADRNALVAGLQQKYGFTMTRAMRDIDVLVVESAAPDSAPRQ